MPDLSRGDQIRLCADPDRTGHVSVAPYLFGGVLHVRVHLHAENREYELPVDSVEPIMAAVSGRERLLAGKFRSLRHLRGRLTYEKLANPRRDVLYSIRAARTDFLPHQFKPVLKFLESPAAGLLIADEVGLGKTIEAGYILKELRARQRKMFRRALVVCPAGLRKKWVEELNRRFGETFEIAGAQRIREALARIDSEGEAAQFSLVASYQTLRSQSVRDLVEGLGPINLTIVDEAHHFRNTSTYAHDVAVCLREISENLVLLSATPVQLGDHNLHTLLRLVAPDFVGDYESFRRQFKVNRLALAASRAVASGDVEAKQSVLAYLDELSGEQDAGVPLNAVRSLRERVQVADLSTRDTQLELRGEIRELSPLATLMSRTRKREVDTKRPMREVLQPVVELTAEERVVYDFFTGESRRRYGSGAKGREQRASRFQGILLQQQMASCLPAFLRSRCLGENGLAEYGDFSSIDDIDADDIDEEQMEQRAAAIREVEEVTRATQRILEAGVDSKRDQLLGIIERNRAQSTDGKIVVFSFYKRTLGYLQGELRKRGIGTELISGDVPSSPGNSAADERGKRVDRFLKDPKVQVLLSSEVGAEGLDFQEASNIVVHYDLPWNPMKVEQRIGRVDRHGQSKPVVYSVAFAIPGTVEERIRTALYERIGIFRETIGDLEEIVSEELHRIEDVVMSPELTDAQREEQLVLIADALVGQRLARQEIEESAPLLMGHDDTFDQELALLEKSGRSISAGEMAEFIESALEEDGIRVVPDPRRDRRRSHIDDTSRLQNFLRKYLPRGVWGPIALLGEHGGLPVALDYTDSKADHFVTAHHPLSHAALEAIAERRKRLAEQDEPVVALRVSLDSVRRAGACGVAVGSYAFALTRLDDIGTISDSYSIVASLVSFGGNPVTTRDAEVFVQHALDEGRDFDSLRLPEDSVAAIMDALDRTVVARRSEREAIVRERHVRNVAMRMESSRSRVLTELSRIDQRTADENFASRKPQYRNMILGQQRRLREELDSIEREFQRRGRPSVSAVSFAFGLVEVVA
jgi:superfamily II DNA or RNA helicase